MHPPRAVKYIIAHTVLVLAGLLAWSGTAHAVEKTDFLVNDDGTTAQQNNPRIAVSGDGSFAVAWTDKREGSNDIYVQRYDAEAEPVGGNSKVNDDTNTAWQAEPALTTDRNGLYWLVWKDYRNGSYPFDADIFYQRFDTALQKVGANTEITTELPDSLKETPDISLSRWGGGVVVWADYRNRNWDIYGQVITSTGAPVGSNFLVNDDGGSAQQHAPRVSFSEEGWFVVVWYDNRLGDDDIFAQRFDSLGNPLGDNIKVNSTPLGSRQAFPDVATDGAGHFTVVWVDWRNGTYPANPDVYARKFNTSMVPVILDTRLNRDNSLRAQREPSIAADRMGNVAIVWSDSTVLSFDITGQMIDVDGQVREFNFTANSELDSAQVQPDVALDGWYRYIAWSDKRNGNYDIYASIEQYNEPTLLPAVSILSVTMEEGGALPDPAELVVESAGYNQLHFSVTTATAWLSVSPATGTTPDTIEVSVTDAGLSYGTHYGLLTLVDTQTGDSSATVTVRLDVTAPILTVSPDTMNFRTFAGLDINYDSLVRVANGGSGSFSWTVSTSDSWLTASPTTGLSNDFCTLSVSALSLSAGFYTGSVAFASAEAVNTVDTLWCAVEVVSDMPYLEVSPDSVAVRTDSPAGILRYLTIANPGTGSLSWTASGSSSWVELDRITGIDGDSIGLTIDTSLIQPGIHVNTITVTDSLSFNGTVRVPLVLDYFELSEDTLFIGGTAAARQASGSVSLDMILTQNTETLHILLGYDTSLVTIDSILPGADIPAAMNTGYTDYPSNGVIAFQTSGSSGAVFVPAGTRTVGTLYFTAHDVDARAPLGTTVQDTLSTWIETTSGSRLTPVSVPGEIVIGTPTDVSEEDDHGLPGRYALHQNYPNPFNPATTISFELPVQSHVELVVYNTLGRRVVVLVDRVLPAGMGQVVWDGLAPGGPAASGVYFYRLRTDEFTSVHKMVLLK